MGALDPQRGPNAGKGALRASIGATAVLLAAFLATVAPARWLEVRCDALALNLVALAASGTAGLGAALWLAGSRAARGAILAAGLTAGALVYAGLEPACLAGPFGQTAPQLAPIWLDHVSETRSILWFAASHPATGLAAAAFVLAGVAAQVALWRRRAHAHAGPLAAFAALAALLGFWQMKLLPYACWLAALPLAVWAQGLRGASSVAAPIARVAAVLLIGQATLEAAFGALLAPLPKAQAAVSEVEAADPRRPCFLSHNVRALAELPPGLVAADIDLGPYIAALTPHRVVAAPYHRLAAGILAGNAILHGEAEGARRQIEALGVDYVALCADRWQRGDLSRRGGEPLRTRLLDGHGADFLQEIEMRAGFPLRVWRTR
jgi:hypothetical protein